MIHHVELYVHNLERSRQFWQPLLAQIGYRVSQQWEQGFSLQKAEHYIVFVQTEERFLDVAYHRCRVGINHLAFHAGTRDDVDRMTAYCRAQNIAILYEDRHPFAGGEHYYALFIEDPERMKVEFVASEQKKANH